MIKKPYTYLFYSVIAFVLFAVAVCSVASGRLSLVSFEDFFMFLLPLAIGLILAVKFFIEKRKG